MSLQRYTKALSTLQRASLVEKSRQKPQERMNTLSHVGSIYLAKLASCKMSKFSLSLFALQALKSSRYDEEPMLRSCGISINTGFTQVDGRVLPAPRVCVQFPFCASCYGLRCHEDKLIFKFLFFFNLHS